MLPPLEVNVRDLPSFIDGDNDKFAAEHANQELLLTGYVFGFMVAYHHPSQQEAAVMTRPPRTVLAAMACTAGFTPNACGHAQQPFLDGVAAYRARQSEAN
jgi:hypothetical protein